MRFAILLITILLNIQSAFAADSRTPIPVSCMKLPNNIQISQVNCNYFSSNGLRIHHLSVVKNGSFERRLESVNCQYRIYNIRNILRSELSNAAYLTGLSLSVGKLQKCYIIRNLCYDSDIHNSFSRIDFQSTEKKRGIIHIGIPILDDCDNVHGSLNGPSYLVLSFNQKTLAMDIERCYYEKVKLNGRMPFDNSTRLRYSPGYVHLPLKYWR